MAQPQIYAVLYTRHLTQKRKTYFDGFLRVSSERHAALITDEGIDVKSGRVPRSTKLQEGSEGTVGEYSISN